MNVPPKIYIFMNWRDPKEELWAAVAESGNALAFEKLPHHMAEVARIRFANGGKYAERYKEHYPDGYQLEFVEDINAPENVFLLNRIRAVCAERFAKGMALQVVPN